MAGATTALRPPPRPRGAALVALGASQAIGGILAKLSVGVAAVVTLGAIVVVAVLARSEARPPLDLVPSLASSVLAWAAGMTLAFAAGAHALRRDRDQGVRELAVLRGADARRLVGARIVGLAAVLFVVVGGGTLLTGLAATAAAWRARTAMHAAEATFASLVYAAAFAAVVAPIALASLGARSRAGGYVWLLMVIVAPELFAGWTAELLPRGWGDVASVPGALASLRSSLMPAHGLDFAQLGRALVVLVVVTLFAAAIVWQQAARVAAEPVLPEGRAS